MLIFIITIALPIKDYQVILTSTLKSIRAILKRRLKTIKAHGSAAKATAWHLAL
tara:strand:+ start:717 stop:878 length:162 start_codon:yes stop_codon:yes gene_type:complete